MLTTIQETVTVGRDGIIQLHVPGFEYNSKLLVVAVLETEKANIEDDWKSFITKTAGSLSQIPISRSPEMNFEKRVELS